MCECFTDTAIEGYQSQYHVQPPLREGSDRKALLIGIEDGTLDAICSAHQPHESAAKCAPFAATATGMAMYDMLVPLIQKLVHTGDFDLACSDSSLELQQYQDCGWHKHKSYYR